MATIRLKTFRNVPPESTIIYRPIAWTTNYQNTRIAHPRMPVLNCPVKSPQSVITLVFPHQSAFQRRFPNKEHFSFYQLAMIAIGPKYIRSGKIRNTKRPHVWRLPNITLPPETNWIEPNHAKRHLSFLSCIRFQVLLTLFPKSFSNKSEAKRS